MNAHNANCLDILKQLPAESINLTVTSPPYDNLRSYNRNNKNWNEGVWREIIQHLYRVTKIGGVVVWIVGDSTIKGSETGTSFKQALWAMTCGFNLHDTMLFEKNSSTFPAQKSSNRYTQIFEYMFIFAKGKPPSNLICDKKINGPVIKISQAKLKILFLISLLEQIYGNIRLLLME